MLFSVRENMTFWRKVNEIKCHLMLEETLGVTVISPMFFFINKENLLKTYKSNNEWVERVTVMEGQKLLSLTFCIYLVRKMYFI